MRNGILKAAAVFLVTAQAAWAQVHPGEPPVAEIKANGSDLPVLVDPGDAVSVTIALNAASAQGVRGDVWVLAELNGNWYHWVYGGVMPGVWMSGIRASYQGPLFSVAGPLEVLNASLLPRGEYKFYFGVDLLMNGRPDPQVLYYDLVEVALVYTPWEMVWIPGGLFLMGDTLNEGYADERPAHGVYLSSFFIDKYHVNKTKWDAVAEWAAVNGYDISRSTASAKAYEHPVQQVTWFDCVKWCNARSELNDLTPCYTVTGAVYRTGEEVPECDWLANGYRLPTEAEWEKAARGGAWHRFGWHDSESISHDRANYNASWDFEYCESYPAGFHFMYGGGDTPYTSPVDAFDPNPYGVHDMSGNVFDWCWDWYDDEYYDSSPLYGPHGPTNGYYRVRRGGSWAESAIWQRPAVRSRRWPDASNNQTGFRTVCLPAAGNPTPPLD